MTRAQELFGRKPDLLKPAVEVAKGRFSSRFLQAVDQALRFRPADRPQTVAAWKALFPPPRLQTPSQRKWLAAGGVFGALAAAGLASVYAIPWWQQLNRDLLPQPVVPEEEITLPTADSVEDSPTPDPAELDHRATARAPDPATQPITPPNKAAEEPPPQPPAEVLAGEAELTAVREPEVAELPPSQPAEAAGSENQLAMTETKTDAKPLAEEIDSISSPLSPPSEATPADARPLDSPTKPPAPAPLQVQPAADTVEVSACQMKEFSVRSDDVQAPYRWWLDGKPQPETGARFSFTGPLLAKRQVPTRFVSQPVPSRARPIIAGRSP